MITFLKRSAIEEAICKEIHCKQTHTRPLCPTIFTVKYNSLSGFNRQLDAVIASLEYIEKTTENLHIKLLA